MAAPTTNASVVTNPGGTGSTITPTLPTHAAGDVIEIFIVNSGVTTWTAPANWTIKRQQASSGNASTGVIGTLLYRRVLSGDTLPLASPVCNLGATVTRSAVALTKRGADLEGVHTLPEWLAFASNAGTSNPVRPTTVTTLAPEMLVHIYYGSRAATTAPEQTNYTEVQQVINSGIIVNNVSQRTIADQNTSLTNQDASPASGARWIAIIACTPSPDYPYYRSGSQAFNANGTNVTPALPAGTSSNDNRGNKDLVILTAQCAGVAPTVNTPAHWTLISEWSNTTSGGVTTVRKWRAVYTGTLDRQVNRTPSGEIFAYLSVYHNTHQAIPVGTSAVQQNASSTTSTFPALPRTGTKATVQATCVADGTQTFTAPSGWTERNDSQGVTCADQSFNATGSTASASFTLSSASPTLAGLMEVFSVASVINLILTPTTAMLALTAFAPTVTAEADTTITPNAASLALTTFAPVVFIGLPFPQTGELDNFNRVNGALGANWAGNLFAGDNDLIVSGNQVKGTADLANNGWATQVGPDCEAWMEIVTYTGHVNVVGRWSALDSSTADGYMVAAQQNVNALKIYRFDNGSFTEIASLPQAVASGDWLGMRISGNVIFAFYKDISVSSEWKFIGQVVDNAYSAAGFIGLYHSSSTTFTDNFGGGTLGSIEVTPANAALTLTSFAPTLKVAITPANTSLTLTAFAPSLRLTVTPAATTLTTTTFSPQLRMAVTPASTNLLITTFALSVTLVVTVPSASLILTTFAPAVSVTANATVTPVAANLSLSTFAATLREVITPASQSLALTPLAPALTTTVTPTTASLSLATFAPSVVTNTILTPDAASLTLAAFAPALTEQVTPASASLTLTTFAPDVIAEADVTVTPDAQSLTLTGFAPQLHEQLTPGAATLVFTTFAPTITISADIVVSPVVASLTLTTFSPSLQLVITPAASTLSLSTFAPEITISADRLVQPSNASLALETFAPQLRLQLTPATAQLNVSASAPVLQLEVKPAATTLTLTTFAPSLEADVTVVPTSRGLTLTTFAPTVTTGAVTTTVTPTTANLTLTTFAPWLFLGLVPANRTYVVESGQYEVDVSTGEYEFLESYEEDEVLVS